MVTAKRYVDIHPRISPFSTTRERRWVSFNHLQTGVDDVDDYNSHLSVMGTRKDDSGTRAKLTGWLQAGTANQESVNVGLLSELTAVLLADTATVDDPSVLGDLGRDLLSEPLADGGVNLLGLLGRGDLAGTDGPETER